MTMLLPGPHTFTTTLELGLPGRDSGTLIAAPRLSVIVPTFCEAGNVEPMIAALDAALAGIRWEVIFVDDDSPDGTAHLVRELGEHDGRVRVVRRIGRRGLAGAVIEGILASAGKVVAVIDGDLQHDEKLLPRMLAEIEGGADLVIGSRYTGAGDASGGFSEVRQKWSRLATRLTNILLKTEVSDPMSGFFMIRRDAIDEIAPKLSTGGFKLLLDILASSPPGLKISELPYMFRPRRLGASKLDGLVVADFAGLLLAKLTGNTGFAAVLSVRARRRFRPLCSPCRAAEHLRAARGSFLPRAVYGGAGSNDDELFPQQCADVSRQALDRIRCLEGPRRVLSRLQRRDACQRRHRGTHLSS